MEAQNPAGPIGALFAIPVYYVTVRDLYNNMIPTANADESGVVGVVVVPIAAAYFTFIVISYTVDFCWKSYQNYARKK